MSSFGSNDHHRFRHLRSPGGVTLLVVAGIAVAAALDNVVLDALRGVRRDVQDHDWYRSLRVFGYLPLWMVVAGALALGDYARLRRDGGRLSWAAFSRSGIVFWMPFLAGCGAAVMKILARRLRPMDAEGAWYVFRPISERTIYGGGLSMPSEHAAVAFAAAFALAILFPYARWVWFVLAAGCAITRLIVSAHYLSDVCVSAAMAGLLAWPAARAFRRWAPSYGENDAGRDR